MSQTTTSETDLPSYIEDPMRSALGSVEGFLNSSDNYVYGSQPGESLYTPMSDQQNQSIGNVGWLADQDLNEMFGIDQAQGMWDQYAAAGPAEISGDFAGGTAELPGFSYDVTGGQGSSGQIDAGQYGVQNDPLSTERLVDEGGFLGSIDSYMNPYLEQVLGPQIRKMNEQLSRDQRSLASNATMSGAFGDARHGVMEGTMNRNANQDVMDTTGRAYSDAYGQAMALRGSDIGRYDSTNQFNTGVAENAASRQLGVEQGNIAANEAEKQRQLQADMQTGQFAQSGAQMDAQTALANLNSYNSGQDRALTQAAANQRAQQVATDNLGTAASATSDLGQSSYDMFNTTNDALYNAGSVVQQDAEKRRQTQEDFQKAISEKRYNDAMRMLGAINGTPQESSTTQTTSSNDGMWGLAGSLLGSIFA